MRFPQVSFVGAAAEHRIASSPRQLSRDYAAGRLVRPRRGVYLPSGEWLAGTASDRYAITTASLAVAGKSPVLCRETALMAWGVEFARVPSHVRYRTTNRARTGAVRPSGLYGNEPEARKIWSAAGGARAFATLPPGFPDAKHLWIPGASTQLMLPHLGLTLAVETFDVAFTDTVHRLPFAEAIVMVDALLAGRGDLKVRRSLEQLRVLQRAMGVRSAQRRTELVLALADGDSESVGESLGRALMWELGFVMPKLQVWITKDGRRIARVDYLWPNIRLAGEFDGLQKYLRSRELSGKSAAQVVVDEKLREDEIRSAGYGMARWTWADLLEPARFATILHRAGVPLR